MTIRVAPVVVDLTISHLLLLALGLNLGAMKKSEIEIQYEQVKQRAQVVAEEAMQTMRENKEASRSFRASGNGSGGKR